VTLIRAWLDLPAGAVFLALTLFVALATAAVHWLSFSHAVRPWTETMAGVVAPYAGIIAALLSFLTGFLASDVWERERQAERAVLAERDGLASAHELSTAIGDIAGVRNALRDYVDAVVTHEWSLMAEGKRSAAAAEALGALLRAVASPDVAAEAGAPVHAGLVNSILQVRRARDDRLLLSSDQADETKWTSVLILALLTLVAIGVVHLERPRAQLAALTVFAVAITATLGLLAVRERPFAGGNRISPAPLEAVLGTLTAPASLAPAAAGNKQGAK
jgi:hypothetical protein